MFHGSMVALVTPMHPDGALDWEGLRRLVDFHIENGTDAIVTVGTTGESPTLEVKEHIRVIREVVDQAQGRLPVIAGTGANSTREAEELTRAALEAGADACLLVVPYYNRPTQEGLYLHFKAIAEAVPIPQILYNVPTRTACDLLPETVARLADISNIVGIKEATEDIARGRQILELCGDKLDLYSGEDSAAMEYMLIGGRGTISVTANVAPKAVHEMCTVALQGNRKAAEAINTRLCPLYAALFSEVNPIPVKWALYEMGLIAQGIRLPLTVLSERYHELLRQALRQEQILQ
ncbi:dihydrodipicolinate synthase [Nitrosococcus oceani ATCC 19707]|uniref:4-hydroxy-tetrahydrodipicolinate synthase n=2 Tax=Nitrosococcus oceani TaxID=1229 RepID=DAPA_NITOC|nr:4-hydroxy-tetrahydrodipicolinate synthase [Nitrosococcus oceani]Q3J869.1 RecName: Full=4-hydroxy-tetrahydrodipicolinate synthase; Short=HTPA synthase [Nitrosococcus oceani ATCC 19707]KFI18599.1 dihydrodipicolinate synthase [Nitrosococcus oceani C-27]ABA58977.1 dihydrodipicolinate synthase [Nitrosococcus oceani ATCC 19707]EDZ65282.1 dihydrodipicolinate synthase [Nitrosococcus oceani AFC27]GEM18927.1 4-hydroxy-tetrahydrodipicolinate synthase [Nitrosococcus oceani]